MSVEIILVFGILLAALVLFFTAWIRMDIVALLVLGTLAVTGLVSPAEALAGFSNPAVVTVWAMFILSAALYQTGVARIIGRQVVSLAGRGEARMIIIIMLTAGLLSSVMNNVGVAALLLPVVMDIARSTGHPPSRLLMPLAFGCLLGGMTTLIGTPSNLLASYALEDAGHTPFRLFDYAPVGLFVLFGGVIFVALAGRHLLPKKDIIRDDRETASKDLSDSYALGERAFIMRVKPGSELAGKTLAESRLRAALGINVLSVTRLGGGSILEPGPDTLLRSNDKLLVQGRLDAIRGLKEIRVHLPEELGMEPHRLDLGALGLVEARLDAASDLIDKQAGTIDWLGEYQVHLLAIRREGALLRGKEARAAALEASDVLLLQAVGDSAAQPGKEGPFASVRQAEQTDLLESHRLMDSLLVMEISQDATYHEQAVADTQIREAFGLTLLGVMRADGQWLIPGKDDSYRPGDRLLLQGEVGDLSLIRELMDIQWTDQETPAAHSLEDGQVVMAEAVLAPRSLLAGKTLREINFRKRYGVTVLAIWRKGRAFRTRLHDMPLGVGEALLLYGRREKIEMLGSESDFILLTDTMKQPLRTHKALTATLVMAGILLPVMLGLIPLAIMAVVGIALMVLTGCLRMEEAYRAIEWRAVFLIAGLLPLGMAMQKTGAAALIAEGVVGLFGQMGPWGVIGGLYVVTMLGTLVIPHTALVVIMSPVVIQSAASYGLSPHTLMMAVAIAAASSFMSPISQSANLLVMGPGGYRFSDFIKLGLPLALVVMALVMLLLPVFWPL